MEGLQQGRGGRGKPVNRDRWPAAGAQRDWLAYCDQVHRENGLPSRRALAKAMGLTSATRINDLLRGRALPADEKQARALLEALGATDQETVQGIRRYKAARAERDQEAQAAGSPGWWLRSGYVRLVGDIVPLQLLDRDGELEELAGWCAGGDEAYVRWQAGPRAGKSALMSWLVLHPPPGTWVISFFVDARLAAQADSTAFTDALLDQLAAITGEQVPPGAPAAVRDGMRRRLLEQAAKQAVKAGRRLVLVVDGLDEDCGSLPGSGLPSIAACLPKRPPDGLRVIVAERPDPPLPADVDPGHPLHRCPVRPLDVSPHATDVMRLAQQELDEVLAADRHRHDGLGYQVLGLVTASGGGLGDRDLQQLTGRPAFEIDRVLRGVFGRTIAGRQVGPYTAARAFGFTHVTLREQAVGRLGPDTLADFAGRLHAWADGYRHRRWPADTPGYLLRGYPRMLAAAGEAGRLAALAADPARHHRMLDATGGDAAALAEIAAAHALISTSPSPDLLAALRLAWHRDQLATRNAHIPAQLPAVWATLGQPARAEALARSITNPHNQAQALAGVATAAAGAGDHDRARELAADAERIARSLTTHPFKQAQVLADVATAVAGAGDCDRAERVARSITYPFEQAEALAGVATAVAGAGDHDRARELAADAERIARSLTHLNEQLSVLAAVVTAAAGVGDRDRARELAADAERIARSLTNPYPQAQALAVVVTAAAAAGDYDRAERVARSLTDPFEQAEALAGVVTAVAGVGDRDRARELAADAERIARSLTNPDARARALAGVVTAAAQVGDYDRARELAADAERIARPLIGPDVRARALAGAATAVAGAGDYDRARELAADAERIARSLTYPFEQAEALAVVVTAVAGAGDYDRAKRIARSLTNSSQRAQAGALAGMVTAVAGAGDYDRVKRIARTLTDPYAQARVLAAVATAAAVAGDRDRARELAADAERIARSFTYPFEQAGVLAVVVTAVAGAGDYDRAERVARTLTDPYGQARVLAAVATAAAEAGDRDRARELTGDAERIARSLTNPYWQARVLAAVATAAAVAGDRDRARELTGDAERIARSPTDPYPQAQVRAAVARAQAQVLADVARAVAAVGDYDRAKRIARSLTDPDAQARVLADAAISVADPVRARSWIADALAAGRWTISLEALARVDPAALSAFAGELTSPQSPSRTSDNGRLSGTSADMRPVIMRRWPTAVRDSVTLSGTSVQ